MPPNSGGRVPVRLLCSTCRALGGQEAGQGQEAVAAEGCRRPVPVWRQAESRACRFCTWNHNASNNPCCGPP